MKDKNKKKVALVKNTDTKNQSCRAISAVTFVACRNSSNEPIIPLDNSRLRNFRSFIRGMGSIVDIGATNFKTTHESYAQIHIESPQMSDFEALKLDWIQTGLDIAASINTFEEEEIDVNK